MGLGGTCGRCEIDLLPVVSGVGETTRAVKTTIGVADDIYDASRAIDKVDTAVDTVKTGWHVGDDITNLTKAGNIPSWSTVRKRFWKNEAFYNALDYSADNINRMKKGLAPLVELDGISYSMELHHIIPRRLGGTNDFSNLLKTTPWEHAAIDSYRWFRR